MTQHDYTWFRYMLKNFAYWLNNSDVNAFAVSSADLALLHKAKDAYANVRFDWDNSERHFVLQIGNRTYFIVENKKEVHGTA